MRTNLKSLGHVFFVLITLVTSTFINDLRGDDGKPQFILTTEEITVSEGGTATFGIKLTIDPGVERTAILAYYSGDTDISVTGGGFLTFDSSNWDTFQTVTVSASPDADTANGTAVIRVTAAGIGLDLKTVTATEDDNNGPAVGVLEFSTTNFSVNENGATVTIAVNRVGGDYGPVTVNYATSNGTATAGSDYTAATGTLNWFPGNSNPKSFTMSITNDSIYEGDETATITLSDPTGTTISGATTATLTIIENDNDATSTDWESIVFNGNPDENPATPFGDILREVAARDDGGLIAVGEHYDDTDGGKSHGVMVFVDASGNIERIIQLDADNGIYPHIETFTNVQQLDSDLYIFSGKKRRGGGTVFTTNAQGDLIEVNTDIGRDKYAPNAYGISKTQDGGYIVALRSGHLGFIAKLDNHLQVQWESDVIDKLAYVKNAVEVIHNDGSISYFMAGQYDAGNGHYLARFDDHGIYDTSSPVFRPGSEDGKNVFKTKYIIKDNQNRLVMVGQDDTSTAGQIALSLIDPENFTQLLTYSTFGVPNGNDYVQTLTLASNGDYLISGRSALEGAGEGYAAFIVRAKSDSEGNVTWGEMQFFSTPDPYNAQIGEGVTELPNKKVVIAGIANIDLSYSDINNIGPESEMFLAVFDVPPLP